MIEDWVFRLDRYLDDCWLDGVVAAAMAGAATGGLRFLVGFLAS